MRDSYLQVVKQMNKFAFAFFGISTMNYLLKLHNHAQVIQKTHEAISSATVVNNIHLFENSKNKTTGESYLYQRYEWTAIINDYFCNLLTIKHVKAEIGKWSSYVSSEYDTSI